MYPFLALQTHAKTHPWCFEVTGICCRIVVNRDTIPAGRIAKIIIKATKALLEEVFKQL
jgi:hypothetical protein